MRKLFMTLLMIPTMVATSAQTEKKGFDDLYYFIENLDVFEYGQEDARAYYIPGHHILLNGKWKFFYGDTPQEIPGNFFEEKFSDSKWATIDVPSNWEMRGYGDPLFRNVAAPFKADPPMTPRDYNPTGAYRTTFTIPAEWNGEEVFLRFEKVASASFL
jgi:beta-galactosidase